MRELSRKELVEKARKVLALSQSPNVHEAEAALLKYRQLVAMYKLTDEELDTDGRSKIIETIVPNVACTKRRETWVPALARCIAENHGCKMVMQRSTYGGQTYNIQFDGYKFDVSICLAAFSYALDSIRSIIKYNRYSRGQSESFGQGFCKGLQAAYVRQAQENEANYSVVLAVPQEVSEFVRNTTTQFVFSSKTADDSVDQHREEFMEGYRKGRSFHSNSRLQ